MGIENEDTEIKNNILVEDVKVGEIPIENCTEQIIDGTEDKLSELCKEIHKNLEKRLAIPPYLTNARRAFVEIKWFDPDRHSEDETKQIISDLLDSFPQGISMLDEFKRNPVKINYGYLTYLKFAWNENESCNMSGKDKVNSEVIDEMHRKK